MTSPELLENPRESQFRLFFNLNTAEGSKPG